MILLGAFDASGVDEVESKPWTLFDRSSPETSILQVDEFVSCFCDKLHKLHLLMCPRYFTICAGNYYCPYYLLLLFVTQSHVIFDDFLLYILFPGSRQSVASSKVNPVILSVYLYAKWRHLHAYVILNIFRTK